ncbi:hypothetical protein EL22_26255 [Halostagnicola sp. A56]|nr:hypothetical protein EL22_26255 [Halostagnicola sp. A56]
MAFDSLKQTPSREFLRRETRDRHVNRSDTRRYKARSRIRGPPSPDDLLVRCSQTECDHRFHPDRLCSIELQKETRLCERPHSVVTADEKLPASNGDSRRAGRTGRLRATARRGHSDRAFTYPSNETTDFSVSGESSNAESISSGS